MMAALCHLKCAQKNPSEPATPTEPRLQTSEAFSEVKIGRNNLAEYINSAFPVNGSGQPPAVESSQEIVRGGSFLLRIQAADSADKILLGFIENAGSDTNALQPNPGYFELSLDNEEIRSTGRASSSVESAQTKFSSKSLTGSQYEFLDSAGPSYIVIVTTTDNSSYKDFTVLISTVAHASISSPAIQRFTVNDSARFSDKLQVSLNWFDPVDMDLHVETPSGEDIYYGNPAGREGGALDLDSNAGCRLDFVNNENITWLDRDPQCGTYIIRADLWSSCALPGPFPYVITINTGGRIRTYEGVFLARDQTFGRAYSGAIVATANVCESAEIAVRGENATGSGTILLTLPANQTATRLRATLNNSPINDLNGSFQGEAAIPFDMNHMHFNASNSFRIQVTYQNGEQKTHDFKAVPAQRNSDSEKVLLFHFVREGYPLALPLPFSTRVFVSWIEFQWSIPATGYLGKIENTRFDVNSADLVMDATQIRGRGDIAALSGNVSWSPDGPVSGWVSPPRRPVLIGNSSIAYSSEPGRDWWFIPGEGRLQTEILLVAQSSAGTTPGTPVNNIITVRLD